MESHYYKISRPKIIIEKKSLCKAWTDGQSTPSQQPKKTQKAWTDGVHFPLFQQNPLNDLNFFIAEH